METGLRVAMHRGVGKVRLIGDSVGTAFDHVFGRTLAKCPKQNKLVRLSQHLLPWGRGTWMCFGGVQNSTPWTHFPVG